MAAHPGAVCSRRGFQNNLQRPSSSNAHGLSTLKQTFWNGQSASNQHPVCRALVLNLNNNGSADSYDAQQRQRQEPSSSYLDKPERLLDALQNRERDKPLVRVRLSVHYRVHSRQMLCIGGSQIPFGWSFLSIAKVPMTWNQGDIWTCEVELPAGQRIEYKYVILEEQDWTKQESEDAEGIVEVNYRTSADPGRPPDVQVITKQMAIVAWQPGPNRIVQVPTEAELDALDPGQTVERVPARAPQQRATYESEVRRTRPDPYEGTWETLQVKEDGSSFLDRHDIWGWSPPSSPDSSSNSGSSSSGGGGTGGGTSAGRPRPFGF